jgi:hypothetical protein
MAIMCCRVSFTDSDGIEHTAEVEAETLYEAVGLAITRLENRSDGVMSVSAHGPSTVEIKTPSTRLTVPFASFARWLNEPYGLPEERARRGGIKKLLPRPITTKIGYKDVPK